MGAWGTGIFSDDTACDVRDTYVELVGDGLSGTEATKRLLDEYSRTLDDPDEGPVFWLALAATQWKSGRLEEPVFQRALNIIDGGIDLARWNAHSRDHKKRQVVLDKLRAQLTSPQPPERRIAKRFRDSNDWLVGDLISYRLVSGQSVVFRVIGHHKDRGGNSPICELLDWIGEKLPNNLAALNVRAGAQSRPNHPISQLMIGGMRANERPDDRLCRTGVNLKPSQRPSGYTVTLWRHLDRLLKEHFRVE
jgi:hypothetical protein